MSSVQSIRTMFLVRTSIAVLTAVAVSAWSVCSEPAIASEACAAPICVEQAWTRATPGGSQEAAFYFSIVNESGSDEKLVAVSTTAAPVAMIHRTTVKDRVVQMVMVGDVTVPAHGRVLFSPGGYHVMVTGLKAPLKEGMTVPAKFSFASGRTLEVRIPVVKASALGPAASTGFASSAPGGAPH